VATVTPEEAFTAISPAIRLAAQAVWHQHPDVTSEEALVSDLSLWVLDNPGTAQDLAEIESVGERVWWLQAVGYRIIREHLAEFEIHRGDTSGRQRTVQPLS